MARISYELGIRGTTPECERFVEELQEKYPSYMNGRWRDETIRSVYKRAWLEDKNLSEYREQIRDWCVLLSMRFWEAEIFYTLTEWRGEEVMYATFREGEFYTGETIVTHSRLVENFGECDCTFRGQYYERYPTEAPFVDCPIRLNPPTNWAIENIMNASECIGMRK